MMGRKWSRKRYCNAISIFLFYFVPLRGLALFEFFIGAFPKDLVHRIVQLARENLAVHETERHLDVKGFFSNSRHVFPTVRLGNLGNQKLLEAKRQKQHKPK